MENKDGAGKERRIYFPIFCTTVAIQALLMAGSMTATKCAWATKNVELKKAGYESLLLFNLQLFRLRKPDAEIWEIMTEQEKKGGFIFQFSAQQ
ncbi:hypothetical protein [Elizabethkingia anophelis]|uniref:Uncharacterized protein n=2 Tax=Elizabethkingia anophelis TaxID=1117645 RepID=A0A077EN41_9FLAO|nr:hypothetical protein [Elizabethkingia anophelis]AIL46985.1 hypothetical protein BD94_3210 [Elizabethkingia anophelis NUHP1]